MPKATAREASAARPTAPIEKNLLGFFFACLAALTPAQAAGQSKQIDPNQILSFKRVFIDPPQDNADGTFRQTFEQAFRNVFERNPRFEIVSEESRADSIVKTRIEKKASGIECEVTLQLHPSGEVFTTEKTLLPAEASGEELKAGAKRSLKTTLKRIPFYGTVTGREGAQLTFDIGSGNGLKQGDVIQIARVDSVKKHPLLKSIVDVDLVPVGSAEVESVEGTIAFGKVSQELPGEKIQRLHKITAVEARESRKPRGFDFPEDGWDAEKDKVLVSEEARPEIGFIGLGPFLGFLSTASSQNNGVLNLTGSALNPSAKLFGELWLTKNWFADLGLGYGLASMTLENEKTMSKAASSSTSTRSFELDFGYRHYVWNSINGPHVFGKLGYGSFTWSTPVDSANLLGPRAYSGLRLGVGGGIPFRNRRSSVLMGLNIGLFNSYSESGWNLTPITTQDQTVTAVQFSLGFHNQLYSNMALRFSFVLDIYSVDFSGGPNAFGTSNTSQKQIGFLPALLYYF